jgi:hypothetical protein
MRRLLSLLALLLATPLFAATFRFDPPVPTNATTTVLTLYGQWPSGCPTPGNPTVIIDESRISITFSQPALACPAVITPFVARINLGVLPAGVYDVTAFIGGGDPPFPIGSTKLVVRDVTTYTITPSSGPLTGGTTVRITGREAFDVEPLHVYFNGIETPVLRRISPTVIEVAAPPQATAGAVDVKVESVMGGTHIARAAFTYIDPNATTPDPFVFTALLFPIDYAGAGAFGAQWATDNVIDRGDGTVKLPVTGSASGRVEYVQRDANWAANSRIFDRSRQSQTAGTEVPVVREGDFRSPVARLLNIPTGANYRAQLRVWTSGEPASTFFVGIPQVPTLVPITGRLAPGPGHLLFGSIDLTGYLGASVSDHIDVSVNVPEATQVWAMVSITNNDTQQVTIVSQQ